MEILHSFNKFSDKYEFEEVLAIPPIHERTVILAFVEKETQEDVAVKCMPNDQQIALMYKIEEMRKRLEGSIGAEMIRLWQYCSIENPFVTYQEEIEQHNKKLPKPFVFPTSTFNNKNEYYAIIMDSVPYSFEEIGGIQEQDVYAIGFELMYTIWIARQQFRFYHGDLNIGNIMFKEKEPNVREYRVGGKRFTINFPYIPVMIDFSCWKDSIL